MQDRLKQFDKKMLQIESASYKRIKKTLSRTKAELVLFLTELEEEELDEEFLPEIMQQTTLVMTDLKQELTEEVKDLQDDSSYAGVFALIILLNLFFGFSIAAPTINAMQSKISNQVQSLYNINVEDFVNRFTSRLTEKIRTGIQQNIIHNRGLGATVQTVKEDFNNLDGSLGRAVSHMAQLAYNTAAFEVLKEMGQFDSNLQKEWVSVLDKRTTPVCNALDGQVKPINEPFIDPLSGSEFMFPPAVWGNESLSPPFHLCRSMVVPHAN